MKNIWNCTFIMLIPNNFIESFYQFLFKAHCVFLSNITTKLCGANEAQRSLRPNERLVGRPYLTKPNCKFTH